MTDSEQPAQLWFASSGESYLSEKDVHVWLVNIKSLVGYVHPLDNLLSRAERSRAKAFIHQADRERFIVAHGVLRILLGHYLNVAPASLKFSEVARKKTCLEGICADRGLQFNISHSHELVILAFTLHRQVGVDIEYIKPIPDLEQVAGKTFSPLENEELKKLQPKARLLAFYRCWTRKEAFVKASGEGLYYPLDRFSVSIYPEPLNCLLRIEEHPSETLQWTILNLEAASNYVAAIAVNGSNWQPVFRQYKPKD